jgi:hypothetical protein
VLETKKCECCKDCQVELSEPEKVNDTWFWIRDTKGYGSVSVTFATVAFWVTTLAYLASIVQKVGPISFRSFDVASCSAYLIPIMTLYFGRRWTEAKFQNGTETQK